MEDRDVEHFVAAAARWKREYDAGFSAYMWTFAEVARRSDLSANTRPTPFRVVWVALCRDASFHSAGEAYRAGAKAARRAMEGA